MSQIVLTPEQSRILAQSAEPVEVIDDKGQLVTTIERLSPAERAALEQFRRNRALNVPRRPGAQVQEQLRKLEEIRQREGGMDEARMHDLLRRMRAGEEV
jgi:hypothetical protein